MNCYYCDGPHDIRNCNDSQIVLLESQIIEWILPNIIRLGLSQMPNPLLIAFAKKKGMIGDTISEARDYINTLYTIPTLDTRTTYMEAEIEPLNLTEVFSDDDSYSDLPDLIPASPLSQDDEHEEFIPFPNHFYSDVMHQWISLGAERMQPNININRKWPIRQEHRMNLDEETKEENTEKENELHDCGICYETMPIEQTVTFGCSHSKCDTCFIHHLSSYRTKRTYEIPACAFCRGPIQTVVLRNVNVIAQVQEFIEL